MGNWSSFEEAFIHTDDHKVLGYRLRPFSLYHQLVLEAIGSPVMGGGNAVTLIDLEIACRICASGYNEYRKTSRREGFWGKVRWAWKAVTCDVHEELRRFDRYFADFVSLPEKLEGNPVTKDGKAYTDFPAPLSVAGCLMANNFEGGSRESIWMTPLGEAHWYCSTFLRMEGVDLKLITEHDREFIEGLRRMKAEKARKKAESVEEKEGETETPKN